MVKRLKMMAQKKRRLFPGYRQIAAAALFILLTGCPAVGPEYVKPDLDVPPDWHSPVVDGLTSKPVPPDTLARWWNALNDPALSSLMVRAVDGNPDLKTAQARVREARARRGISRAGYFPILDASASASKNRTSEASGASSEFELYAAGFDAGWELDIFGGQRRSVEAAEADLSASQEALNHTMISLLAEVALNYMDVRALQARISVAEENAAAQNETFELTRSRFAAGLIDELAVQGARYSLAGTRAQIPTLKTALEGAKNRLAVLLGETPGALHRLLADRAPIPVPPLALAIGVPADTLRQRPDVRRAERALAAQTARIGVAKAELYPRFRLFGALGYEALSTDDFFSSGNLAWRFGPGISWRLFDGGAVRQNIEVQSARQEQSLSEYQTTVLRALEEAENALTAYVNEQNRRENLIVARDAAERAFTLARDQYRAGLVPFSDVLIAQRALLSFEDQLAQSDGQVTTNLVRVYKSLGGGWTFGDPSPPGHVTAPPASVTSAPGQGRP
jgi:NodT family efflux transporter outer membrane factor (OMF) lipoprotein